MFSWLFHDASIGLSLIKKLPEGKGEKERGGRRRREKEGGGRNTEYKTNQLQEGRGRRGNMIYKTGLSHTQPAMQVTHLP